LRTQSVKKFTNRKHGNMVLRMSKRAHEKETSLEAGGGKNGKGTENDSQNSNAETPIPQPQDGCKERKKKSMAKGCRETEKADGWGERPRFQE